MKIVQHILVSFPNVAAAHTEHVCKGFDEHPGFGHAEPVVFFRIGDPPVVGPHRKAVLSPVTAQGPAGERFSRVPFALPVVQQAARRPFFSQTLDQRLGQPPLLFAQCIGVPLGPVHVIDGNECGLASHGQPDVGVGQFPVDPLPQGVDGRPDRFRVGTGGARRFVDAPHAHLVVERDLAFVHSAGDRGRALRLGRAGQRNVPFAGEKPGGGVHTHPPGPGKKNFGPGVQVGKIAFRTRRAVQ